jgi:hypothetical protein
LHEDVREVVEARPYRRFTKYNLEVEGDVKRQSDCVGRGEKTDE